MHKCQIYIIFGGKEYFYRKKDGRSDSLYRRIFFFRIQIFLSCFFLIKKSGDKKSPLMVNTLF